MRSPRRRPAPPQRPARRTPASRFNRSPFAAQAFEVRVDEQAYEPLEAERRLPAQPRARLRGIADQVVELGGATDERLVDVDVLLPVEPDVPERELDELADTVRNAGRDHVVVRLLLLEHQPHRAHVVACIAPVAAGLEVAQPEVALEPERDRRRRARDLARQEVGRPAGGLVVEEDPRAGEEAVALAVAADDQVAVRLRDT